MIFIREHFCVTLHKFGHSPLVRLFDYLYINFFSTELLPTTLDIKPNLNLFHLANAKGLDIKLIRPTIQFIWIGLVRMGVP